MRQPNNSQKNYLIGFSLSLILTLTAYLIVVSSHLSRSTVASMIMGLAVAQLIVQLVFFLHLGREGKPRWNLYVFLFMLMVIVILVGGSLWIMYNLDYNHGGHRHGATSTQIIQDEGVKL